MESYAVSLIEQPTGAVHNVVGAGIQPILDEQTGEPETQFVLVAEVNGHLVPLQTFTKGYIEHQANRPDTAIADDSSSSSSEASPAAGEGTAGEGAAAPSAAAPTTG